jgi:uncharacterized protein (DUF2147 family)
VRVLLLVAGILLALTGGAYANVVGMWHTEGGRAIVSIAPCGENSGMCGKIVWLRKPFDKNGKPLRDGMNQVPALRSRGIIGIHTLLNMQPSGNGKWSGRVYDPERGKIYAGRMRMLNRKKLKITGCKKIGPVPICKSRIWHR